MNKPLTPLRKWAHRNAVARVINAVYENGRYQRTTVQTCLPWRPLARYANSAWYGPVKVLYRERYGRFEWRWWLGR